MVTKNRSSEFMSLGCLLTSIGTQCWAGEGLRIRTNRMELQSSVPKLSLDRSLVVTC